MATDIVKLPLVPFTVINNSGQDPIYLYVHGRAGSGEDKGRYCYLSDENGDCTLFRPNVPTQPYGLKLTGKETKTFFPQLDAGRIYISLFEPLKTHTDNNCVPYAISADVKDLPNYHIIWDFAEATWHDYGDRTILHFNATQVDAFGLAFRVEHQGLDPDDLSKTLYIDNGFGPGDARMSVMHELAAMGAPWSSLIIGGDMNGPVRRALMPVKAIQPGPFPEHQLDKYINEVMSFYGENSKHRLELPYGKWTYVGHTTAHEFVFKLATNNPDSEHAETYRMPKPTTKVCYENELKPVPFDDMGRAISAALAASFMRSTLIHYPDDGFPVPQEKRKLFYTKEPINHYARLLHKYGLNNHAFAFGQDEVAEDAGKVREVANPEWMKLTVQKAY